MAIFYSSGHHLSGSKGEDPGAIGSGYKENELTQDFESYVMKNLKKYPNKVITDNPDEPLRDYLARISPGKGSVVCESHFNAFNGKRSGVEVVVPNNPTKDETDLANEISKEFSKIMEIPNRGVITESQTARKSLAIMKKDGINVLIEICFIDNKNDVEKYQLKKKELSKVLADLLVKYDNLYT